MGTTTYQAVAIINEGAGARDKEQIPARLREICAEHGISCRVEPVTEGSEITAIARRAVESGAELVLAGGGDGTLRAVAQALTGTRTVMAVLPVGTLNHFARDLELPLSFEEAAAAVIGQGVICEVDVAQANDHVFINNAVIGLYPHYRSEKDNRQAHGWGSRAATVAGMLAAFWRYPILKVHFSLNGIEIVRRTPYVLIGNNEHAMEGARPWERNSLTEGRLFVYILRDHSRFAFPRILLNVMLGRFHGSDQFEMIRTSEVTIHARRRKLRVSLDGEMFAFKAPVVFRSLERALRVLVPPGSKRAGESAGEMRGGITFAS